MCESKSEAIVEDDGKVFLYVETNEEGIADFKRSSKYEGMNVELSSMIVEGKTVPAFKFEVTDFSLYQDFKREQWRQEDAWKQEQRCIICGENGKSKRCPLRVKNPNFSGKEGEKKTVAVDCTMCPFNRQFRLVKGMVSFSSLELRDKDGNVDPYTQPNRKLFDVMTKGSGDARMQPLYFLITTAGTDTNSICYETHQKAKDILAGRKIDATFYPVIYGADGADDWTDPKVWKKANPSFYYSWD